MEGEMVESREWYMAAYARDGVPSSDHLKLRTVRLSLAVDSIPDNHLVLKSLWISIDPYLRSKMAGVEDGLYSPQFAINQVIKAYGIGRIIRSKDPNFMEGDMVICPFMPVAEFCVVPSGSLARKIDNASEVDPKEYLASLGVPGFAAWIGIELIATPRTGENVFISAGAGGVGMIAGQLAKLKGCRVVGSAGSDDKVKSLKEEFGFDDAFNYKKETDLDATLTKFFPDGIDVYFDNVGGQTLEAVLNHVNLHARIPLCGMISEYNKVWTEREGVRNLLNLVGKEVRMQGFVLASYLHRFGDFMDEIKGHLKDKKITSKHQIYKGIERFIDSLNSLFSSSNVGKVILEVNEQ